MEETTKRIKLLFDYIRYVNSSFDHGSTLWIEVVELVREITNIENVIPHKTHVPKFTHQILKYHNVEVLHEICHRKSGRRSTILLWECATGFMGNSIL